MVAVFHRDSGAAVIDALLEIRELLQSQSRDQTRARPPEALSPQRDHTGDKYAAAWVVDAFANCGIMYRHSERGRSAICAEALPLFSRRPVPASS